MPPRSRSQRSACADSPYGTRSTPVSAGSSSAGTAVAVVATERYARGIVSGRLQERVGGRLRPRPVHGHAHVFPGARLRQEPARRGESRERESERGGGAPGEIARGGAQADGTGSST